MSTATQFAEKQGAADRPDGRSQSSVDGDAAELEPDRRPRDPQTAGDGFRLDNFLVKIENVA
jgi:hypothetical protein